MATGRANSFLKKRGRENPKGFALSPLVSSPKVLRNYNSPAIVKSAQRNRILITALLVGVSARQYDMSNRFGIVLLAGANVNLVRLKSQAGAIISGQPCKLFKRSGLLIFGSHVFVRSLPIFLNDRLEKFVDAFFGPSP